MLYLIFAILVAITVYHFCDELIAALTAGFLMFMFMWMYGMLGYTTVDGTQTVETYALVESDGQDCLEKSYYHVDTSLNKISVTIDNNSCKSVETYSKNVVKFVESDSPTVTITKNTRTNSVGAAIWLFRPVNDERIVSVVIGLPNAVINENNDHVCHHKEHTNSNNCDCKPIETEVNVESTTESTEQLFCTNCGIKILKNWQFCNKCGQKLN